MARIRLQYGIPSFVSTAAVSEEHYCETVVGSTALGWRRAAIETGQRLSRFAPRAAAMACMLKRGTVFVRFADTGATVLATDNARLLWFKLKS
jgi:hypothetical protein